MLGFLSCKELHTPPALCKLLQVLMFVPVFENAIAVMLSTIDNK